MKTLRETVDYIYKYMMEYDRSGELIEKEILYDMMEEELLDTVEEILTEEDMKNRVEAKDDIYLDKILNEKLEDYPALLKDIKNNILNEYIVDGEDTE